MTSTELLTPSRIAYVHRRNSLRAWEEDIRAHDPKLFVTLGVNAPRSLGVLRNMVKSTLLEFDREVLQTNRVEKRPAKDRLCAFIAYENLETNAHAHLLVWHPVNPDDPEAGKRRTPLAQRDACHILPGPSASSDASALPLLERLWMGQVPGGHYDARCIVPGGFSRYHMKQFWTHTDRDPERAEMYFSEKQRELEYLVRAK